MSWFNAGAFSWADLRLYRGIISVVAGPPEKLHRPNGTASAPDFKETKAPRGSVGLGRMQRENAYRPKIV
jgi:hypothetical protein